MQYSGASADAVCAGIDLPFGASQKVSHGTEHRDKPEGDQNEKSRQSIYNSYKLRAVFGSNNQVPEGSYRVYVRVGERIQSLKLQQEVVAAS